MNFKCQYCDPVTRRGDKPVKSIDTDTDSFVKLLTGKYYHEDCYRKFLHEKKKKMSEEDIELKIAELKERQAEEVKEIQEKDKLLRWLMNFYDGTLPTYFLKKLHSIRDGSHESIDEYGVSYVELLDIYEHMAKYLHKVAMKKNFKNITQHMNYDLAIIIGNVGDYRRYMEKRKSQENLNKDLNQSLDRHKAVKVEKKKKDSDGFDLQEDIDDLLL